MFTGNEMRPSDCVCVTQVNLSIIFVRMGSQTFHVFRLKDSVSLRLTCSVSDFFSVGTTGNKLWMADCGSAVESWRNNLRLLWRAIHRDHIQIDLEATVPNLQRPRHHACDKCVSIFLHHDIHKFIYLFNNSI